MGERETLRLSLRLMLPTLVMDIPMPTPVSPSVPALDWTPSPRVLTQPPRDMSHTTDTDTTLMVITTERGLLMLRLRLRLIPPFCTELMDTPMVLAILDTASPTPTELASPPPTPLLDTPWPTLPEVLPTPPMSESAPTTWELLSPARLSTMSFV